MKTPLNLFAKKEGLANKIGVSVLAVGSAGLAFSQKIVMEQWGAWYRSHKSLVL
ncbi:MAG: hypothetical protein ACI8RA_002142 [Chlamydiales bacterium]|jgi:hypothetical protein